MSSNFIQIYRFLIVGIIVVSVDGFFYFLLNNYEILTPEISKRISFIIGAILAFILNKNYVFFSSKNNLREPIYFTLLYFSSFLINSISHDIILYLFNIKLFAFLCATAISTVINFSGQKYIVFKK